MDSSLNIYQSLTVDEGKFHAFLALLLPLKYIIFVLVAVS